jgi:hypothetical protein
MNCDDAYDGSLSFDHDSDESYDWQQFHETES